MPDPTILRVHHIAAPFPACALPKCPRGHWFMARCECGWRSTSVRRLKAKAALEKHGEEGCGG